MNRMSLPGQPDMKRSKSANKQNRLSRTSSTGLTKLKRGVSVAQVSVLNQGGSIMDNNTDLMISKFMDVHNNKITELLGYDEK